MSFEYLHTEWVIQGGESGPVARSAALSLEQFNRRRARAFDVAWARQLREECRREKVSCFLKQLGSAPFENNRPMKLKDRHGGDWKEWPDDLCVRQMPNVACPSVPTDSTPQAVSARSTIRSRIPAR